MARGKLIVIYGINNLGKSTQAKQLVNLLQQKKIPAAHVKYPLYDVAPSGPMINSVTRKGNPWELTPREIQTLQALNKAQYHHVLLNRLDAGEWIVAEDYRFTSVAWGIADGVDKEFLVELISNLVPEDIAILLEGDRFMEAVEAEHRFERNTELVDRAKTAHSELADKYGWERVNANESIAEVTASIWKLISKKFDL